jgi:hypothetical protein
MIPGFQDDGFLPPGVHWSSLNEIRIRLGTNPHRRQLLAGLTEALKELAAAGCSTAYIDGSFVSAKNLPADYDACWDLRGVDPQLLDPVFLDFSDGRAAQKRRFMGEFFPAQLPEGASGRAFLEFFQMDKDTGKPKGILAVDLRGYSHDH